MAKMKEKEPEAEEFINQQVSHLLDMDNTLISRDIGNIPAICPTNRHF